MWEEGEKERRLKKGDTCEEKEKAKQEVFRVKCYQHLKTQKPQMFCAILPTPINCMAENFEGSQLTCLGLAQLACALASDTSR